MSPAEPAVALPAADWRELSEALTRRASRLLTGTRLGAGAPRAEDLAQEVMVRLHTPAAEAELEGASGLQVRKYAYRSLHNLFIDRCVRKRREHLLEETTDGTHPVLEPVDPRDPDVLVDDKRRVDQLRQALGSLSAQERSFLEACVRTGSATAAQKELGWPPGGAANAGNRRSRLILRLRSGLAATQPSDDASDDKPVGDEPDTSEGTS